MLSFNPKSLLADPPPIPSHGSLESTQELLKSVSSHSKRQHSTEVHGGRLVLFQPSLHEEPDRAPPGGLSNMSRRLEIHRKAEEAKRLIWARSPASYTALLN